MEAEDRCKEAFRRFTEHTSNMNVLGIEREKGDNHSVFTLFYKDKKERYIPWLELNKSIKSFLSCCPEGQQHIVLDITSLELDTILYIMPLLIKQKPASLYCLYLVPKVYKKKEQGLVLQDIQQPKGYISFKPGIKGTRDSRHYILLGFDKGRATRFIDNYDWEPRQIHGVLGDPSYVKEEDKDGVQIALDSNSDWITQIEEKNIHRLPAHDVYKIKDFFCRQREEAGMLDIVPLGPKPMLLGTLLFYLGLNEDERANVRFLYDYPTPKKNCTTGIEKGYLFDCCELL